MGLSLQECCFGKRPNNIEGTFGSLEEAILLRLRELEGKTDSRCEQIALHVALDKLVEIRSTKLADHG